MYRNGFENLIIWLLLFVFFGPVLAIALTDSLDAVVLQVTPYLGTVGIVVLAFLALRMFFR